MHRHAVRRWLAKWATGTSCFLGAAALATQVMLAAPPSLSSGRAAPGPADRTAPAEATSSSPAGPVAATKVIVLPRRPQDRTPSVASIGCPQQLVLSPTADRSTSATEPETTTGLEMETAEPPTGLPAPVQYRECEPVASLLYYHRGPMCSPEMGVVRQVAHWDAAPKAQATQACVLLPPRKLPARIAKSRSDLPHAEPGPQSQGGADRTATRCLAHAPDYTWIIGQVEHSGAAREWRLRYASAGEEDRFGGRVTLIENQHVSYLRDGMYVKVIGHLVNPDDPDNGPIYYRVESFQSVELPSASQAAAAVQ